MCNAAGRLLCENLFTEMLIMIIIDNDIHGLKVKLDFILIIKVKLNH